MTTSKIMKGLLWAIVILLAVADIMLLTVQIMSYLNAPREPSAPFAFAIACDSLLIGAVIYILYRNERGGF